MNPPSLADDFSPIFPGPYRSEMSREVRALFRAKEPLRYLVQVAVRLNVRPMIAKPVPLCMFSREELIELTAVADLKHICEYPAAMIPTAR